MLGQKEAIATIAVADLTVARRFYEGTLGLTTDDPHQMLYRSGSSKVLVYESKYASTNRATSATWAVGDDIGSIVDALKSKGVVFERYDFPDMQREGDVHVFGTVKSAWFKDPDGNILALVNG